ncbi:MAG: hypothetical protein KAJ73_00715 [Zetaproteobacteria bacterium]|nr:hypothetical protein [Zetaproteobacteria bacterium]
MKKLMMAWLIVFMLVPIAWANNTKVAAGFWHTVYIDGTDVYGMGRTDLGSLANTVDAGNIPHPLGIGDAKYVAAGPYTTVVLLNDGYAVYFGYLFSTRTRQFEPQLVPAVGVTDVAPFMTGLIYVTDTGAAFLWDFDPSTIPMQLPIDGAVSADCGDNECLVLDSLGQVWSIGSEVKVVGTNAKMVSHGRRHKTFVHSDNNGKAWGSGRKGQIGDGFRLDRTAPVALSRGQFTKIMAGGMQTLGITESGDLYIWGFHNIIRSSEGLWVQSRHPTMLSGIGNVREAYASLDFSLILTNTGELYGWGGNKKGKLGLGHTTETHDLEYITTITIVVDEEPVKSNNGRKGRQCNEQDANRGHGNDCDRIDDDNTGGRKK